MHERELLPCSDAFLARLSPSGSSLQYSTYLGGSSEEYATSVAVDSLGNAYLTGYSLSGDFPTTPGAYDLTNDQLKIDAFVVKVSGSIQEGMQQEYDWRYEYDGLSRLIYACSQWDSGTGACLGESFGYTYDGAGNALSFSRWSGSGVETVGFVYNRANQILCQDGNANGLCGDPGDVPYTYDAYGNLTGDGVKTYVYDAENRLVSTSDGVSTTSYSYNGDGDRVSQTVDGVLTSYVLDTAAALTMVLVETTGTDTIYYLHGLDLVAQSDGVSTEYFGYDGLGSVRQLLDEAGNVLFARVYDPYGNPFDMAGTSSTSFGFTGEQEDGNGLLFLRARYYDSKQGRFLQSDPWQGDIENPISLNPWLYVTGNPINHIDPSGMCEDKEGDGKCDPEWRCYKLPPYPRDICLKRYNCELDTSTTYVPGFPYPPSVKISSRASQLLEWAIELNISIPDVLALVLQREATPAWNRDLTWFSNSINNPAEIFKEAATRWYWSWIKDSQIVFAYGVTVTYADREVMALNWIVPAMQSEDNLTKGLLITYLANLT